VKRVSFCPNFKLCERLLLAAVSTGGRNTRWKSSCLVFSPEGFAGVSEGLAQQTLVMIEWKAQIVG
jgi:hypothetical protein